MPPMNNRVMRPRRRKPDAPVGVVFTVETVLAWQNSSDGGSPLLGFRIYADGELIDTIATPATSWSGDISSGTAYTVAAVNAVGEGPKSRSVRAT